MRKILNSGLLVLVALIFLNSCGSKPEEKVHDFAVRFADFVNASQKDSVEKYYPGFQFSDSLSILPMGDILVQPEETEGEFLVVYSPKFSMKVKIDKDGDITVENSKGIFAYPENQIELARKEGNWNDEVSDIQKREIIAKTLEKRKSFTSPDLDFFNLHGPVKSMTVSVSPKNSFSSIYLWGYMAGWDSSQTYTFDEEGVWSNYNKFRIAKIKRNDQGQIISLHEALHPDDEEVDPTVRKYFWNGNKLSRARYDWSTYTGWENAQFSYKNDLIVEEKGVYSNTSDDVKYVISFKDFQTDGFGNWTNCSWTLSKTAPDYENNPERDKTTYSSGNLIRKITYY